jgi:uncharacterized membrane protein YidH (DUF202 family)
MKALNIVGVLLILLGIAGLVYGHVNYTSRDKVLDLGPIHATAETEHTIPIPDIASIAAILAGLALVVVGLKRT